MMLRGSQGWLGGSEGSFWTEYLPCLCSAVTPLASLNQVQSTFAPLTVDQWHKTA